jgi:hypothetical protein
MVMVTAIEELTMKNILITEKRKQELIKSLTLDEKLYLGSVMLADEYELNTLKESDLEEVSGELTFGNKTYEDGNEVFVSNKY